MGGLSYKVEQRSFGFDKENKKKFVATSVRSSTVSFDKVVEQVAIRSGIIKPSAGQ